MQSPILANNELAPARTYAPGIGDAVADRTINRVKPGGTRETWADVALRVAAGNAALADLDGGEFSSMHRHLRQASLLMSGRHLQHGDLEQPSRPQEVFTNCLDYSTRILTMEHGPIEIGKIAGQIVTVIAGDGVPRQARINEHGEQPLQDISFRSNAGGGGKFRRHVTATPDHRWKLRDGAITTSLKVGDVLAPIHSEVAPDPAAVIHGLVYGDGSAHKCRRDHGRPGVSQGRTYASIRVCKQDAVRDEIHQLLDAAGYEFSTPPSADGDRVYYIGKFAHAKELPFTNDPEYIAGFIYGWWLADGSKGLGHALEISTSDELAAAWINEHAGFAGYNLTLARRMERTATDGSFPNGKALHCFRLRKGVEWKVDEITPAGSGAVYCPEEPVTGTFVLANGLLTGNCSTAASSFLLFYLLLNGSGVGRAYDDDMMLVDWSRNMPHVRAFVSTSHPDVLSGEISTAHTTLEPWPAEPGEVIHYLVPDSREGWAKAVEQIERLTFEGTHRDTMLVLDFSQVRHRGTPIAGMQNRPASGPGPLIAAIEQIKTVRDSGMAPWKATMHVDHYLAECVLVGGARRAARMATKTWRDGQTALDFVSVKKGGVLWSSNNSITVDEEFWNHVKASDEEIDRLDSGQAQLVAKSAKVLFEAICSASYHDGTGEPGIINVERLTQKQEGIEALFDGNYAESARFKLDDATKTLTGQLAQVMATKPFVMITNPCGEISLVMLGGYCVIADVVPYFAKPADGPAWRSTAQQFAAWDDESEDAFRTAARALIRVNTMDCLYRKEVQRTNRIGVGITGLHEWAWARFGLGWKDIVNEEKSIAFWRTLGRMSRACVDEARRYSALLGVVMPHTVTTMKPAGTTSKLFGLTEGAHLPSMREYLRWVQFRNADPLIEQYRAKGYPVRELVNYKGTTIVGFPTVPEIVSLGMGDKLVTAAEATPEEQYEYLRLLEKWWIDGYDEATGERHTYGNQVSYTLKYDPKVVGYEEFRRTLLEGQSTIKCCSVMPQADTTAYEYQPEEPVTPERFREIVAGIKDDTLEQDIGLEHVDCGAGGCPIDFASEKVAG